MASGSTTTHIYSLRHGVRSWETLCGVELDAAEIWRKLDTPIHVLYADQPEAAEAACEACRAELTRRALHSEH